MSEFIVLGLIPGTQFELTFNSIVGIVSAFCLLVLARKLHVLVRGRNALITLSVVLAAQRFPLESRISLLARA